MNLRTKLIIILATMCIVDIVIPIPILGVTLVCVVAQRPPWFIDMVNKIYDNKRLT